MIPEAISIGRAVLSVRLLLVFVSVGGGLFVAWTLLGPGRSELRKLLVDSATSAAFVFLVVWKVTPVVTQFATIRREPLLLLYASGGTVGIILGALAALGYTVWILVRRRRTGDAEVGSAIDVARAGALAVVSSLVVFAVVFFAITIVSSVQSGETAAAVGRPAPAIELETLDGGLFSLGEVAGTPVVVNFWATWCGPCRAETVVKNRLAAEFAGSARVVGVNLTNSESGIRDVEAFAEEWGVTYPILLDRTGRVGAAYGVRGTPTTVVIGADGTVSARIFGAMSFEAGARAIRAALR
ncbi:MAG: hypothetical protein EA426_03120 [Spirochaetaceae bacterium]|nr:MAG: hypothetical protein EA426_03120 [Spirochaetaceae bacterium]